MDEQGKPISGVKIDANVFVGVRWVRYGVEETASRADGSFKLFNYPRKEGARGRDLGFGFVFFAHPDYIE